MPNSTDTRTAAKARQATANGTATIASLTATIERAVARRID